MDKLELLAKFIDKLFPNDPNPEIQNELRDWAVNYMLVPKDEYYSLLDDSKVLAALYNGGVDNWEWYDASLEEAGL